jgi:hypothetical protein
VSLGIAACHRAPMTLRRRGSAGPFGAGAERLRRSAQATSSGRALRARGRAASPLGGFYPVAAGRPAAERLRRSAEIDPPFRREDFP